MCYYGQIVIMPPHPHPSTYFYCVCTPDVQMRELDALELELQVVTRP